MIILTPPPPKLCRTTIYIRRRRNYIIPARMMHPCCCHTPAAAIPLLLPYPCCCHTPAAASQYYQVPAECVISHPMVHCRLIKRGQSLVRRADPFCQHQSHQPRCTTSSPRPRSLLWRRGFLRWTLCSRGSLAPLAEQPSNSRWAIHRRGGSDLLARRLGTCLSQVLCVVPRTSAAWAVWKSERWEWSTGPGT